MSLWGKTDSSASIPKHLNEDNLAQTIFVDLTEAGTAATKLKGITGPGWWKYFSYSDSAGNIRHKAELLVPLKASAGTAGDSGTDAGIDVTDSFVITLTTKPVNRTVSIGAGTTFAVVGAISVGGGSLSYQWQVSSGGAYSDIANAGVYSGATGATLTISDTTGLSLNKYRVIVSATNAVSVTSPAVKLTLV